MQSFAEPEGLYRASAALARRGVVTCSEPTTTDELSELVRDSPHLLIRGNDCTVPLFRNPGLLGNCAQWGNDRVEFFESPDDPTLWSLSVDHGPHDRESLTEKRAAKSRLVSLEDFYGIVEHDRSDQVVTVRAGYPIGNLNSDLADYRQCIPIPEFDGHSAIWTTTSDSVGSLAAMNLPHGLSAQCGSWRDWVLGMKVVLADGSVIRCGSKAVKNVAGYDLQKLFVGSRNSLGIIVELILRTYPLKSLPPSDVERFLDDREVAQRQGKIGSSSWWVQRVIPANWTEALAVSREVAVAADHASYTLYAIVPGDKDLARFPGDWVIRSGCGEKNIQITDLTQIRLMKRAKAIFDPQNKLNPGEWGFM